MSWPKPSSCLARSVRPVAAINTSPIFKAAFYAPSRRHVSLTPGLAWSRLAKKNRFDGPSSLFVESLAQEVPALDSKEDPMKARIVPPCSKIATALLLALLAGSVHAASTRGLVVAMDPIPGSPHCKLTVDDEFAKRKLHFLAQPNLCAQREQWVGKTALFHLSLVDLGRSRLEPVATRVKAWPDRAE